jgi:cytochrome c5
MHDGSIASGLFGATPYLAHGDDAPTIALRAQQTAWTARNARIVTVLTPRRRVLPYGRVVPFGARLAAELCVCRLVLSGTFSQGVAARPADRDAGTHCRTLVPVAARATAGEGRCTAAVFPSICHGRLWPAPPLDTWTQRHAGLGAHLAWASTVRAGRHAGTVAGTSTFPAENHIYLFFNYNV